MSNIDLKPIPVSHLSETNEAENFYAFGYTDKNGVKKSARIPASLLGGKAHAKKYDGTDILTARSYKLGTSEEMYVGSITDNMVLSETNIASCYGTLYMLVKNNTTQDKTITFPTANYSFFPKGKGIITVPQKGYIELAIKGYGSDRAVTDISSLEEDKSIEYTAGENVLIQDNVISAKDTVYDDMELKAQLDNKANKSHAHDDKQDKLTAGENVIITDNVISVTNVVYDDTELRDRLIILENLVNNFFNNGGTIGGNLQVIGDINAQRFLKDE